MRRLFPRQARPIQGSRGVDEGARGLVSTILVRKGEALRYLRDRREPLEVEFLLERGGTVVPVEVKASNASTASLDQGLQSR